jgi:hypothetical protein
MFTATVENKGFPEYVEKGFVYGKRPNPAKGDDNSTTEPVTGTGFTLPVSDLEDATRYYVRAYIVSEVHGIQYGEEKDFTTSFTDPRDGKMYKLETFGSMVWMAEDFVYRISTGTGKYTWQEAVDSCPKGWHLPTSNEIRTLAGILGSNTYQYFPISDDAFHGWWSAIEYSATRAYYYAYYYGSSTNRVSYDYEDLTKTIRKPVRYIKNNN